MNEKIIELLRLCLELNPTKTLQEKTGNKPTVFFRFSGHVNRVEVSFYLSGWEDSDDTHSDYSYIISPEDGRVFLYQDSFFGIEKRTIDDVIEELKKLKEEA